jgi:hypothetical protein
VAGTGPAGRTAGHRAASELAAGWGIRCSLRGSAWLPLPLPLPLPRGASGGGGDRTMPPHHPARRSVQVSGIAVPVVGWVTGAARASVSDSR